MTSFQVLLLLYVVCLVLLLAVLDLLPGSRSPEKGSDLSFAYVLSKSVGILFNGLFVVVMAVCITISLYTVVIAQIENYLYPISPRVLDFTHEPEFVAGVFVVSCMLVLCVEWVHNRNETKSAKK